MQTMIGHNNNEADNDKTQLMMQTFIYCMHSRQNNDETDIDETTLHYSMQFIQTMIGHNNELTDNDRTQLMMQSFIYSVHSRQNNDKTDNFRQRMIRQTKLDSFMRIQTMIGQNYMYRH